MRTQVMGIELLEIWKKMRKLVILATRGCFRSVCNHPILVGFLCFLILLYRSSPFIFSLLLSTSPILICTAVLLGVLLSYGEPNIPEIEVEEKTTFEAVSMKTGVLGDTSVAEQTVSSFIERFSERIEDLSDADAPPVKEISWGIELDDGESSNPKLKTEWGDERKLKAEVVQLDDDKSEADSFDSEKVNVASLDSPPCSPWKRIEEREEEEGDEWAGEDDVALDSGSDGAESSSPDASMADIIPMLDELHPLLDDENPQPIRRSHSGSDEESEKSSTKSSTKSRDSDDESEDYEDDLETQDDDNEVARGETEDRKKSAIIWTQEDEKNLMDLGCSEIERNQRLENLILRRRARKNMRMVPERNLIDLENIDNYPSGLAHISTRRGNPFDPPQDSYDNISALPPVPGSAPSVLLQRQNPFDIPYDSSEEKPNLMGDGFKEEFITSFQSRETVFRRHESFNVGPSVFAPEMKDVRMRPYFVPKGTILEESSYSLFQRHSSELSESKVSSGLETESIGSAEDLEDKKLADEDSRQEIKQVFEGPLGDQQLISRQQERNEDANREQELISEIGNVSEHVGHGSRSSEGEKTLELDQGELGNVADHYQQESIMEVQAQEYHENCEDDKRVYIMNSNSASSSEASERIFTEIQGEGLSMLEERRDGILAQTSTQSTNLSISGTLVVDFPQRSPVYDSIPRGTENDISSSSISSVGRGSQGSSREIETDIPSNVESWSMNVVDIREHDNVNTDFSEKESGIEIFQVSVEENLMVEHGSDEVSFSSADGNTYNMDKSSEESKTVQLPDSDEDEDDHVGYQRSGETLIPTPSVEGSTYPFHDRKEIHEPNFQHLDEMQVQSYNSLTNTLQASSSLVESLGDVRIAHNLNMPEVQELDHDIPSDINSPLSPESISNQSDDTSTIHSHVNVQTTIEEVHGIKEIDEELLSELDSVGDFSVTQWGFGSSEFEKHRDSVQESLAHQIETSTARVADVDSVKGNKIEDVMRIEKSKERIDIYEEDIEYISELQTSKMSGDEHINVSRMEFNERDGMDSSASNTSENAARPDHLFAGRDYEDNVSEVLGLEVHSEKDELTSLRTENTYQVQVHTETTSRMHELEVSKIKDIDLAIKEIAAQEINKPVVLEPRQPEQVLKETLAEHYENGAPHENSIVVGSIHKTSVFHVGPVEKDAILDSNQSPSDSVDRAPGTSSEWHKVLDGKSLENNAKADEVGSSMVGSRVLEIGVVDEKTDNEVEETKDEKGKISRSSSSSSNSSSESSSSNSERD
ncbi:hypothetical protein OROMI_028512 [Orobanche minor]